MQVALWQELHTRISQSKILPRYIEWTPSKILVRGYGETWQAHQSIAAKRIAAGTGEAQAEGGAGLHAKHLLIVVSEASGVEEAHWDAKLATLTGGSDNRLLAIGNPVRRSGRFYEVFMKPEVKQYWWTRNVRHDESSFANQAASQRLIEMYGEDSPIVRAKVYGEFPTFADGLTIFGYDEVQSAFARVVEDNPHLYMQVGVDVARGGDNESVVAVRRGRYVLQIEPYKHVNDLMHLAEIVVQDITRWYKRDANNPRRGFFVLAPQEFSECMFTTLICIDDVGVGGGLTDALKSMGWKVMPIHGQHAPRNGRHYKSRGDEIWMVDGKIQLNECYVPRDKDDKLLHQLCTREVRYDAATGTKKRLESKPEMERRGLPSPDRADALMLALATVTTVDQMDFRRAFTAF